VPFLSGISILEKRASKVKIGVSVGNAIKTVLTPAHEKHVRWLIATLGYIFDLSFNKILLWKN
jgi:hypothetical protein